MKSIIQKEKECFICKTCLDLQLHHVIFGSANRKLADEDGLTVYLCLSHHTGALGVHHIRELDLELKRIAERAWMEHYGKGIDDFRQRYGKSYL